MLLKSSIRLLKYFVVLFYNRNERLLSNHRIEIARYDTAYSNLQFFLTAEVDINKILVNLLGVGLVPIIETPHYKFSVSVISKRESPNYEHEYFSYLKSAHGDDSTVEAALKFQRTIAETLSEPDRVLLLAQYPTRGSKQLVILDGTHRLAVLACLHRKSVRCALI